MKRKTYMVPTTQIVFLKQRIPLLSGSPQASLNGGENPEEEDWE